MKVDGWKVFLAKCWPPKFYRNILPFPLLPAVQPSLHACCTWGKGKQTSQLLCKWCARGEADGWRTVRRASDWCACDQHRPWNLVDDRPMLTLLITVSAFSPLTSRFGRYCAQWGFDIEIRHGLGIIWPRIWKCLSSVPNAPQHNR